jgi:hypothetical protein
MINSGGEADQTGLMSRKPGARSILKESLYILFNLICRSYLGR